MVLPLACPAHLCTRGSWCLCACDSAQHSPVSSEQDLVLALTSAQGLRTVLLHPNSSHKVTYMDASCNSLMSQLCLLDIQGLDDLERLLQQVI